MSLRIFLLTEWSWHWSTLLGALVVATIYGFSLRKFGTNARWGLFLAAVALVLLALCSPLNALAEGYLFSAHMVQHLVLLLIAPAFIILSLPSQTKVSTWMHRPTWTGVSWLCGVGAMWFWHVPLLCDAASSSGPIHGIQSVSLLTMGTLFWWPILAPSASDRVAPWHGVIYLFTACLACTALGILITLTPIEVCSIFAQPIDRFGILPALRGSWGMSPERDREIGGLLMWVPMCAVYLGAILLEVSRWYRADPQGTPDMII